MKIRIIFFTGTFILMYSFIFSSCDFIDRKRMNERYKSEISLLEDTIYNKAKKTEHFYPSDFSETSRLFYICKVWGFLKYYHENALVSSNIDIDKILLQSIGDNKKCTSKAEFESLLLRVISSIQVSPPKGKTLYPNIKDYMLVNNIWMKDTICLSASVNKSLEEIFLCHQGNENNFMEINSIGRLKLKNEKEYTKDGLNENVRLLSLFRYWNIINYFFVYKGIMDRDWDEVLFESIPRFKNAVSIKTYHWEIARLTNQLQDGHANMPTLEDTLIISSKVPIFNMQRINNTFVVQEILVPRLNKSKLKDGDIILEIDNKNVHTLYDSLKNYIGAGSYWATQRYIGYLMLSNYKDTIQLRILRNQKDTLSFDVENIHIRELNKEWKQNNSTETHYKWLNDSIAYLNLNNLKCDTFDENYKPIKNAKSIIIDLRNYPDNYIFEKVTDAFVPKRSSFCIVTYPDVRFPGMIRYKTPQVKLGSDGYYKGKLILLVSERTGSFSEYLTMALQQNPNLITVGRSTAGTNGNIITTKLPGGIEVNFSGIGIYYPDFTPTQRCGVKIDYIVTPTIESIKAGRDVALEQAKELLIK